MATSDADHEAEPAKPRFHGGLAQGFGAIAVAAVVTGTISAASWDDPIAPRLALVSFVIFVGALALGSSRIVGLSSCGVLGSALIASAMVQESTWVESVFVGCAWYVAVELAWDSVERRDDALRSGQFNIRRVQEVSSIVAICLVLAAIAFAATALGPSRTLASRAMFILIAISGLAAAIGHISATAPNPTEEV